MAVRACRVVLVTAPSRSAAERIASALVHERLAACASIVPMLASYYRWKGKVCRDAEVLLLIKTTASAAARLRRRVRALHPAELPEIVELQVAGGDPAYLAWVGENVA